MFIENRQGITSSDGSRFIRIFRLAAATGLVMALCGCAGNQPANDQGWSHSVRAPAKTERNQTQESPDRRRAEISERDVAMASSSSGQLRTVSIWSSDAPDAVQVEPARSPHTPVASEAHPAVDSEPRLSAQDVSSVGDQSHHHSTETESKTDVQVSPSNSDQGGQDSDLASAESKHESASAHSSGPEVGQECSQSSQPSSSSTESSQGESSDSEDSGQPAASSAAFTPTTTPDILETDQDATVSDLSSGEGASLTSSDAAAAEDLDDGAVEGSEPDPSVRGSLEYTSTPSDASDRSPGWAQTPIEMPSHDISSDQSSATHGHQQTEEIEVEEPSPEIGGGQMPAGQGGDSQGQGQGEHGAGSSGGAGHVESQSPEEAAEVAKGSTQATQDANSERGLDLDESSEDLAQDSAEDAPRQTEVQLEDASGTNRTDEIDTGALPEALLRELDRERSRLADQTDQEPWHEEVRGVWELVEIDRPAEDFLPSGARRRILGIDPASRTLRVELHSAEGGRVVQAAEYEAGFRPGLVEVLPAEDRPSDFPITDPLLLDGDRLVPAALSIPVEVNWSRDGELLRIGGAVYVASNADQMRVMQDVDEEAWLASEQASESEGIDDVSTSEPTVDFFGIKAEGRYIGYIVDVSGSMGRNGGILRLRTELERSLATLPSGTRFVVLPFNSNLLKLQPRWTRASRTAVRQTGRGLTAIGASGGTNPAEAFEWSFRQLDPRPDEIFFMTDGAVNDSDSLIARLRELNGGQGRTRIHTIGFGGGADRGFLKKLAEDHGGTSNVVH